MNKIKKVIHYLAHDRDKFKLAILVRLARLYRSDEKYLKKLFRLNMGKELNLDNPQTFSEKLQWLKLHNRKPEYTQMVDKVEVKKYVADIIGEEYIIPTLGVYNSVDEIDFEALPNQFVLKTTHGGGGGGVVVCKDKATLNIADCKRKLQRSMKHNIYWHLREWPYKNVKPRIIAEKFITDSKGEINDFKFSCYNGVAEDVMICLDRASGDTKFYFFNKEWNLLRYNKRGIDAPMNFTLPKPQNIELMFDLASKLAHGTPYLRVDLYNVDGQVYFGEMTFYPSSGMDANLLTESDILFGSKIRIN